MNLNFNEMAKGVYKITNIKNGKVYIGSSSYNIKERWNKHLSHLRTGKHISKDLQNDYYSYGVDCFEFEVIERMDDSTYDEIRDMEQFYIEKYISYGSNGYNSSSVVDGGNSNNVQICVYDSNGKFIELLPSKRRAMIKYDYTGVTRNIFINKNSDVKIISSIGYIFIEPTDVYNIPDSVDYLIEEDRDVIIYDIMNDRIEKHIGLYSDYINYLSENYTSKSVRTNAIARIKNKGIIKDTNGHIFAYKDEIPLLYEANKDLLCLCCFDLNGNFLSKDFSKTHTASRYNIHAPSINSCSKSNNVGDFKRKLRTYSGYIFKHYKLSEIPNKINVINGETIS